MTVFYFVFISGRQRKNESEAGNILVSHNVQTISEIKTTCVTRWPTFASFLAAFLASLLICLLGLSAANPSIADLEEVILVAAELLTVGLEGSPFFLLLHMLFGRNGYNATKNQICVKLNNNLSM